MQNIKKQLGSSFIRFNDSGNCEKVSWFKNASGEKFSEVEPFKPGTIELSIMAQSKSGQAYITKEGSVLPC